MARIRVLEQSAEDRAKQAYAEFVPLDGKFLDNVLLQVKNGPIDFQPREPVPSAVRRDAEDSADAGSADHQGIPRLRHTSRVSRYRCSRKPCVPTPLRRAPGSTVSSVIDGSLHGYPQTGMAGVANIGADRNWTGSHFDQANWYAFGRLAWDPSLAARDIAEEWVRMTFSNDRTLRSAGASQ